MFFTGWHWHWPWKGSYFVVLLIIAKQWHLSVKEPVFPDVFWIHLRNVAGIGLADLWSPSRQSCFVPYKTFSRYKTLYGIHLVPPKTFSRNQIAWKLPALARRVWGGKDRPSVAYQSAWSDRQAYMGSFLSISYVRGLWFPEARPNSWNNTK